MYDAAVIITCLFLFIHSFICILLTPPLSLSLSLSLDDYHNSFLLLLFTIGGGSVLIIALLLLIFRRHILPPPNQLHVRRNLSNQLLDRISSKLIDPNFDNARYFLFFSYLKKYIWLKKTRPIREDGDKKFATPNFARLWPWGRNLILTTARFLTISPTDYGCADSTVTFAHHHGASSPPLPLQSVRALLKGRRFLNL